MPDPLVSIIIPVYNAERTILHAANTCRHQTLGDFELLLVDDQSSDETPKLLKELALADSRIRVLTTEPPGRSVAAAFQLGFQESRGRFIARMDADDLSAPERLERQVAMLEEREEIDVASCLVRLGHFDGQAIGSPQEGYRRLETWLNLHIEPDEIAAQRFVESPVVNPSALFRRETIEVLGGYRDLEWAEDYDLWLRLLHAGGKIAKVPEVLFYWLDSETRLTRTAAPYTQDQFLRCKAHYLSLMPQVEERGVAICGAGPIGKRLSRYLRAKGVVVHDHFEVHPRRIGQVINGVPVRDRDDWIGKESPVMLGAVGLAGQRGVIASMAVDRGYSEGKDFFSVT